MEIKTILVVVLGILILDMIWLGFVAKNFYKEEMKDIARLKDGSFQVNWFAAFFVYILLVVAVMYFVQPVKGIQMHNFLKGALLGLIVYGVYDLTNYAMLKDFSLKLVAVDMVWGTFLLGAVSFIAGALK